MENKVNELSTNVLLGEGQKRSITVIGAGRLAWSLIPNLQSVGFNVQQLISRQEEKLTQFQKEYQIPYINTAVSDVLSDTALVFITVNDAAIEEVATQLKGCKATVFHTSGSISQSALSAIGDNIGIVYPLQIFTLDAVTPLANTPIFYEGKSTQALEMARFFAQTLSAKCFYADSSQRLKIHLGAVFACNFSNYLYRIAAEMLPKEADFSVYKPLIEEQIYKAFAFSPEKSQTGPAIRGDIETLQKHIQHLADKPDWQDLYVLVSQLINPKLKDKLILKDDN